MAAGLESEVELAGVGRGGPGLDHELLLSQQQAHYESLGKWIVYKTT